MTSRHLRWRNMSGLSLLMMIFAPIEPAKAVMLLGSADPAANKVAPTASLADSGWQYQGYFGSYMGTMISPTQFITAKHIGVQSSTFVYDATFSGGTTTTYTVDTINYQEIPNSDLVVYTITSGVFPTYAEIFSKPITQGLDFVMMGKGFVRSTEEVYGEARDEFGQVIGTELKGWKATTIGAAARWGTNEVSGALVNGTLGELILASFDDNGNPNEAYVSVGDSGGGVFAFDTDDNKWKLIGINYGDSGFFNTSPTGTDAFRGAIFDLGGLYVPQSWTQVTDQVNDLAASSVISDVSARYNYLMNNVIVVPEPGSATLLALTSLLLLGRRRSR